LEQSKLNEPKNPYPQESRKEADVKTEEVPKKERKIFFETKSMAEVYAKQGHITIALEIYKRIFKKNPSDAEAQKRILELEAKLSSRRDQFTKPQTQGNSK
jgi:tetratricopeptide (TPR) repeat protein